MHFKSKEYKAWEKLADQYGLTKPRLKLFGEVCATYYCGRPSNRRMDVANREKGISDTLVRWGVLDDDCQITDIRLLWSDDVEKGFVRVVLEEKTVIA